MFIALEELQLHRISVSKDYAPDALDYHGAEFRQVIPLRVDAVAELVGSEIRIRGQLSTELEAGCDRCLGTVRIPVDRDFELFYQPLGEIAREEEIEIAGDDLNVGFYSGEGIELVDVLTEQIILSVPMKLVCRPDCKGLCPACGVNRNVVVCTCPELAAHAPSPFSSLMKERPDE